MLLATTVELFDGLVARGIPGQGRLAEIADTAKYDATHVHADLLVVGAGPAGLAAALTRGPRRARGWCSSTSRAKPAAPCSGSTDTIDGAPALDWVAAAVAELATYPGCAAPAAHHRVRPLRRRLRPRAAAAHRPSRRRGPRGAQPPAGVADPRPARPRRRRRARASRRVHRQRPPGHHARARRPHLPAPLRCQGRRAGRRVHHQRQRVRGRVRPARRRVSGSTRSSTPATECTRTLARECDARGITIRTGVGGVAAPAATAGSATPSSPSAETPVPQFPSPATSLLVSGGWNPAVHLFSQVRGKLRYDETLGAFVPGEDLDGVSVAGSAHGVFDLAGCLRDGQAAGQSIMRDLGFTVADRTIDPEPAPAIEQSTARWCCGGCRTSPVRTPSSSTCSATRRSPTWPARSAQACARWSTSSATPPSAPRTIRARRPG